MAWKREVLGRLCDGERFQIVYPTQREARHDFDEFCDWLKAQDPRPDEGWAFHALMKNGNLRVRFRDGVVFFDSVTMAHRRCGM